MPLFSDPTLAAGELDQRVTLLEPLYNQSEDEIVGWQEVTKVWAGIDPNFAMETDQAGRQVEKVMVAIVIRYRRDIDARWRIQDHEHLYDIKGLQDIARRRVHLLLTCQEVL
jgi:SPP1 family predicted phage head-tail adaptor